MTATGTTRRAKPPREAVQLLTIAQVAEMLHVSRDMVYKIMRSGELDWRVIGQQRRIRSDDLAAYIERNKQSGDGDV